MIPLVLLDIDGTLIGSSGGVKDCVWEAAEKARAGGVKLAVCTGRPCAGVAQRVAQRLGPNTPHIFQSGALLAYGSGETLQAFALKEALTKGLIEHARSRSLVLELYTPSTLFVERKTPLSEAHAKMIGVTAIVHDLSDVAENEPVVRAQWVIRPDQLDAAEAFAPAGLQFSQATSPVMPDTLFVSITRKGVSKGAAARELAATLKVSLENVMGVGDSTGDLPMLELVGHPVVMGNAPEKMRSRFERVVGEVDDCGVVAALDAALTLGNA